MSNVYKTIGDRVRKTAFVFPIFVVFFLLLLGSSYLMVEDYFTSLWGFQAVRMNPGFKPTPYIVAAFPQLIQIAAYYINLALRSDDERLDEEYAGYRRAAGIICICMLVVDVGTDFRHRILAATTLMDYAMNLIITLGAFTIGSEVVFTASFGTVMELWPDAKRRWAELRQEGRPARPGGNRPGYGNEGAR